MKKHTISLFAVAALGMAPLAVGQVIYDESWATDQAVSSYANWSSNVVDIGEGINNMPEPSVSSGIASAPSGSSGDGFSYSYFNTGNFTLASGNATTWNVSEIGLLNSAGTTDWDGGAPEAGAMVWLGGTSTTLTSGDGYFAGNATNNAIGIYRYTGGVGGTVTKILTGTLNPGTAEYDMQVSFDGTDTWSFSAAPTGNPLTSQGTVTDTTFTGDTFVGSGFGFSAFAGGGANGRGGQVGDISMTVVPEPSTAALLGLGASALLLLNRRRRSRI